MHQILDLTADIGFIIEAPTREAVLRESFECLADILYARNLVLPLTERLFIINTYDAAELLHDFLAELVQLILYERFLLADLQVSFTSDLSIVVRAQGEFFERERHKFFTEVKAVTRHMLTFENANNVVRASFVLDL